MSAPHGGGAVPPDAPHAGGGVLAGETAAPVPGIPPKLADPLGTFSAAAAAAAATAAATATAASTAFHAAPPSSVGPAGTAPLPQAVSAS
ncbi:unnamed protein product, partial [Ectocarpus sp. 12 AP-2014]